jgi:hypothetical protein
MVEQMIYYQQDGKPGRSNSGLQVTTNHISLADQLRSKGMSYEADLIDAENKDLIKLEEETRRLGREVRERQNTDTQ